MSRRNAARKREIMPDPLFQSTKVTKLVNHVMKKGKKSTAERIVYGALNLIAHRSDETKKGKGADEIASLSESRKKQVLETLIKALDNVSPRVEVKSRRVGGSTYQVPVEVRAERRDAVGMRLLVTYAAKRGEKNMDQRLANEIMDATRETGGAFRECLNVHKTAEANKAFAHYRW